MRIWIAKKGGSRPRHVVVDLAATDEREFLFVVHRFVLPEGVQPWRERSKAGTKVRYRFAMRWLERLVLTFPVAERAPAIDAKLAADSRAHMHRLKSPPPFEAPSFRQPSVSGYELYPHQLVSIDNALKDPRHMVNIGMGLGKTAIGWAVACRLKPKRMLVVTTYGGKAVWADEAAEWTRIAERRIQVVDGAAAKRREQIARIRQDARILVVNWDLLRLHPELADIAFDYMVVDEFHRAKNPDAQVTKSFLQLRAHRELLLSGTPMINRTEELWSPLHRTCRKRDSLRPSDTNSRYPSAWLFEKSLRIKFGGGVSELARNPDFMEKIKQDLDQHSTRFRRDQVSDDLPDIIPVTVTVKLTDEQRKLYNKLRDEFKMELESGEVKTVRDARVLITRLKQACWSPELYGGSQRSAKLDELRTIVRDLVDAGEKAILYSQWSKATRILAREFAAYGPAYVDGSVTGKKRQAEARRFNKDPDCLVAGAEVQVIGELEGATRSLYSGPVVDLVVGSGERLTVTVNHPVLTRRGWIPADLIREGDEVAYSTHAPTTAGAGHNNEQAPVRVEDLFQALASSGSVSTTASGATHFHGDGVFMEGEVETVAAQRGLLRVGDASLIQKLSESPFMLSDAELLALSGQSSSDQLLLATVGSSHGSLSHSYVQSSLLAEWADLDSGAPEAAHESVLADAHLFGEGLHRLSRQVPFRKVIQVGYRNLRRAHVYNLQTSSGGYLANHIAVHNCKLYIGTIGANREAITLNAATYVIFTDKDWSPHSNDQARDRSASGGLRGLGKGHVHVIELLAEDTVDLEIEALLGRKRAEFNTVIEQDGGDQATRTKPITLRDLLAVV